MPTPPVLSGDILIVDDNPANLRILADMLRERGYKTRPAPSGKMALRAALNEPPDLVLLDINMPDMNGYEVCEHLKSDGKLKDIPVIFISALTETMDKVKAFSLGGVDYITKPFQFEEVAARVHTHLEIRRQKRELEESYEKLRGLEALRDNLVHMIVHDIRSSLTGIQGFLQLLARDCEDPTAGDYINISLRAVNDLVEMATSLLDVSRLETGMMPLNPAECDLTALSRDALKKFEAAVGQRQVSISPSTGPIMVEADPHLIARVIRNLLGNALKFTSEAGEIRIAIKSDGNRVRFSITDNGPGIISSYHEKIFEKFVQADKGANKGTVSSGLGLAFCKLAIEAHGGKIGVESEENRGSTFWFELPGI